MSVLRISENKPESMIIGNWKKGSFFFKTFQSKSVFANCILDMFILNHIHWRNLFIFLNAGIIHIISVRIVKKLKSQALNNSLFNLKLSERKKWKQLTLLSNIKYFQELKHHR